jgi:hypothetical protein
MTNYDKLIQPTTYRGFKTIVEDVDLMRQAMEIRKWLVSISTEIPRLNEAPNPFYGSTLDGLALIQYYGGPSAIATPYGSWACSGGGIGNDEWFAIACDRLGLVEVMAESQTRNWCYGPIHAITKGLEGNLIQPCNWKLVSYGGVGIVSESMFETAYFEDVVAQANKNIHMSPDDTVDMYNLQKHIWNTQMKPALGFKEWNDN